MDPTCPYFGLIDNFETITSFPTQDNACHRASPPAQVALHYQRSCCLDPSHTDCPGFIDGWENGFPKALLGHHKPRKERAFPPPWVWLVVTGVIILLLVIGAVAQLTGSGAGVVPTIEGGMAFLTPTMTKTPTVTRTLPPTLTATSTPEATPTVTETPFVAPTQTAGPALETPFGPGNVSLAIYQVSAGETLALIANRFGTTREVLMAINVLERPSGTLWEGDLVVVCIDCQSMEGMPRFQPRYVEERAAISDLATAYGTTTQSLREWNGLNDDDWIESPRWIIVEVE